MNGKRVVVVTGGAGALGSTLVRARIAAGDAVAAVDVPQAKVRLEALANELGPSLLPLAIDARSESAWNEAIASIEKTLGAPTGAALIAGGWAGGTPLHAMKDDSVLESMQAINFETAYRSLRALLPGMVARKHGSIVVVGSRAVSRPWESAGAALYAATKAAVVTMAQAVAAEVVDSGVRINAVLPSVIDTAANRASMPKADPSRWVAADSLADVIGFLLGDGARDVTGAALPVHGRV